MKPFPELRVVEIAGSTAGAFAGKLFADYGASVVKVEPPEGDPLRANGEPWGSVGSEFAFFNTSKRSLCLDLASAIGRDELARLLDVADVVIESSAPDPLEPRTVDLGGDGLVRAYVSPFGLGGPYGEFRSNVFTDDAIGGHMYLSGEPDREPIPRAGLHTHFQAGAHAFIGCMAALLARERIGTGQDVEVSHFEGMVSLHQHTTTVWTHAGTMLRREGNAQPGPPHPAGVYPSKDGYVFLCHSGAWKLVPFVEALGQAQIFGDPRFATDASRALHKREFDAVLNERLTELTTEEIIEIGVATRSPLGPVPPILEVFEDSQLEARNFWVELGNEKALRFPRGPFAIEGHPSGPATLPLETGELALEALLDEWTAEERGGGGEQLSDGPLQGLRVLDMTRVWSGPIAGRLLGDLGANSILIESPWNRGIRHPDPEASFFTHPDNERGEHPWNRAGGFNKLARNKRSLTLDMKKERAREVFAELVKQADVVLENYSPRVMPQFGFDFESLKKLNPRIVYTSISGYGSTGPGWDRVALGPVMEAGAGLTQMMGYPDSGPYRSGVAWADPVAGMSAVAGTLVALWNREASGGEPQRVETAMSEAMQTFAGEELLAAQVRATNAPRRGARHAVRAPQGCYRCAGDDRWVAISVTSDDEWRGLCEVMGLSADLAGLPEDGRRERHDEIDEAIGRWTQAQSPKPVVRRLQARGVIAAPLNDGRDLLEDPHLAAREFWAVVDHAEVGVRRYPGNAIKLSKTPVTFRRASPLLGEHNEEILGGLLGMSEEQIGALSADGVITTVPPEERGSSL